MKLRAYSMGAVCALAIGAMTIGAEAAPTAGRGGLGADTPNIEKTAAGCWWRGGRRHCLHGYRSRYREYGYAERYRTGTRRWWSEMDREQRGGRRR